MNPGPSLKIYGGEGENFRTETTKEEEAGAAGSWGWGAGVCVCAEIQCTNSRTLWACGLPQCPVCPGFITVVAVLQAVKKLCGGPARGLHV